MNKFLPAVLAALFLGTGSMARAQDSILAELYGQGVHAYFAGDYTSAHELLTSAIEQGSRDPRCYYFRGLTHERLGRPTEAIADLKKGAIYEATSTDRIYPVSDSLQRVQGYSRIQIEKQRQLARLAVKIRANQIEKARYEQTQQAGGSDATRRPDVAPSRGPARGTVRIPATDKSDPFAGESQVVPEKAPERAPAVVTPMPESTDVFGEATTTPPGTGTPASPEPADADPFAPAEKPAADDSDTNPFSDDMPAEEKPAEAPAETPEEADPFGD